ncbi:MAG: hypothetical protein RL333_732 [Pseudomonadota bacterium]
MDRPTPVSCQNYDLVESYITKDGSEIRELMHPAVHRNTNQSLAEAMIQVGGKTHLHKHLITEELYHIIRGHGLMTLQHQVFAVKPGDTVCIPPGTHHSIENTGQVPLVFLCSCSPAYSHQDTELLD